jgi:hypothetical protein
VLGVGGALSWPPSMCAFLCHRAREEPGAATITPIIRGLHAARKVLADNAAPPAPPYPGRHGFLKAFNQSPTHLSWMCLALCAPRPNSISVLLPKHRNEIHGPA